MGKNDLIIIGIGASAGGLEALQSFVSGLPDSSNMSYVVAQHLSPTYKSLMADLLAKGTDLQVVEAKHGLVLKSDTIYICPPNKNITIRENMIALKEPQSATLNPKPSIDILFESLAEARGDKSVGIILSGTGSDGSRGVRAIKAEGGFAIAQEPDTAKYDGMPNAAINTGTIDLILKPEQMGTELLEIFSYPERPILNTGTDENLDVFQSILSKLNIKKGINFSLYKPSTIQRRIERRMAALKITGISTYHNYLMKNEDELEALFKDILIGVTSFFRDREAFDTLTACLEKKIEIKKDKNIRIWAPGCSTGEEAYSIAMVVNEILGADIPHYKVQIFATDIDEEATTFARKGLYPESALQELDKTMRNKYFTIKNEQYEIIKPIREMCIFSRHDISKDPSFLRLDLITCRNLLIYFSQDLQKKLIPLFHYALNDNGLLFLGKSESVGHFQSYFKNLDKKWKIYEANYLGKKEPPVPVESYEAKVTRKNDSEKQREERPTIPDLMVSHINQHIIPTCVVVNDAFDLVYVRGKNPYLVRPDGESTDNIYRNVIPVLSVELRAALHVCKKEGNVTKTAYQKVVLSDDMVRYVRMIVMPMDNDRIGDLMMICFQEEEGENFRSHEINFSDDTEDKNNQLELELARTKEHLQTVIEELETSNEEMQSLNEELQSSNEELQSSNEELETTNEELQSTNEELQTAYTEMRAMYDEKEIHSKQLADMQRVLEQTNLRLETSLKLSNVGIYEHNIPAQKDDYWSEVWASILGYTIGDLPTDKRNIETWELDRIHPDDREYFRERYDSLLRGEVGSCAIRFRMQHKTGHWVWVESFIKALERDQEGRVIRILGASRDVSEDVEKQWEFESLAARLSDAQKIASIGSWEWDIEQDTLWWSEGVYDIFGLDKNAFEPNFGSFLQQVHEDDRSNVKTEMEKALAGKSQYDLQHRLIRPRGYETIVREIGTVLFDEQGKALKIVGTIQDVTKEVESKRELLVLNNYYAEAQEVAHIGNWEWNIQNNTLWWSDNLYRIFTADSKEGIDFEKFYKMVHEEDVANVKENFQKALDGEQPYDVTFRVITTKTAQYVRVRGSVARDQHGKPFRVYGTGQDVTDSVLAQETITANEERLRLALKGANMGVWDWNVESGEVIWDEGSFEMFGMKMEEGITYEKFRQIVHSEDIEILESRIKQALETSSDFEAEFRIVRSDGEVRMINGSGTPLHGSPRRMVGVNRDITSKKEEP